MTLWPALALFVAFLATAAVDGVWFHERRFRLWAHPETRLEHALHTIRALLLPPTIYFLFRDALALALACIALDFVAAVFDVVVERRSRRRFGGLAHGEYAVHLLATLLHGSALALAVTARLVGAVPLGTVGDGAVLVLVLGSSIAAIQHVVLLLRGRRIVTEAA
jgi:hypothetical protein